MGTAGQSTRDPQCRIRWTTAVRIRADSRSATYGHYVEAFTQVFPTLTAFLTSMGADVSNGSVQVQVAP